MSNGEFVFQATRRRLALWYSGVTALLLLVFATGVYGYVRSTLIDRIDDTLKHVVEVVERSLVLQSPNGENVNFERDVEGVGDDRIDIEWFDSHGQLLWSTFPQPLDLPLQPYSRGHTVRVPGDTLLRQVTQPIKRNIAEPLQDRAIIGYLRVSHPWFEVTKPIRQLIVDLSAATLAMVGCAAAVGWWLSGIAIQPVRDSYQRLKQFTADASHELRNPIATIQTNVQTALAYPDAEPQQRQRQLQAIERLTRRLGRLVNDLLFLARSDSGMLQGEEQDLPLDALLIEAIEEQRLIAEQQGVYLSVRIIEPEGNACEWGEKVFAMKGDWDRLARLFTNLISNALEHAGLQQSGELGREAAVEVELQRVKKERTTWLQVQVRDTGTGIPESAVPNLFDRFYRVDPARAREGETGTGLGLAIARAIVESHRGQISVSSVLNRGTTFTVLLPASY